MLNVERWAELRRLHFIDKVSIRELHRRTGLDRKIIRRALRSDDPPKYTRPPRPSKLEPFKDEIHRLLKDEPRLPATRVGELIAPLGYAGGQTILNGYLREVRPLFDPPRSYQRTEYAPGEIAQFDLWEPSPRSRGVRPDPTRVRRRGRAHLLPLRRRCPRLLEGGAGPSSWACGIASSPSAACRRPWSGTARARSTPATAARRRPSPASAASSARAGASPRPRTPRRRDSWSASRASSRRASEPGRLFASAQDFQRQLDAWFAERANVRLHRRLRARPVDRLAQERPALAPLPEPLPDLDRRFVLRVPPQPYARFDTVDYSLDPRFVGRRIEVRVSQAEVSAVALDTGELVAQHERVFARHRTVTALEHARLLRELRGAPAEVAVEERTLRRYDALIPA